MAELASHEVSWCGSEKVRLALKSQDSWYICDNWQGWTEDNFVYFAPTLAIRLHALGRRVDMTSPHPQNPLDGHFV